jgi:hypothetical protein
MECKELIAKLSEIPAYDYNVGSDGFLVRLSTSEVAFPGAFGVH